MHALNTYILLFCHQMDTQKSILIYASKWGAYNIDSGNLKHLFKGVSGGDKLVKFAIPSEHMETLKHEWSSLPINVKRIRLLVKRQKNSEFRYPLYFVVYCIAIKHQSLLSLLNPNRPVTSLAAMSRFCDNIYHRMHQLCANCPFKMARKIVSTNEKTAKSLSQKSFVLLALSAHSSGSNIK